MDKNKSKKYRAAIYLRLSKEDGDVVTGNKLESNSISNQKDLVMDFLKSLPEIEVVSTRVDDGYSGVDFNRPEFQKMLEDLKAGVINCIVVKDLSRFGRNYIEAGRYLEKIFPMLGVRFIAINDNYDSENPNSSDIMVAFKNLINDSYLRDLSVKIRSHLEVKRRNGEFIGNYACYGYLKSEEIKNQLIVDNFAAEVVKDIFRMKLEGLSPCAIAKKLNAEQVLSPMEYKKSIGIRYETSFKANKKASWSTQSVLRILTNEIYTGVLLQGKHTTPNHKVKIIEKVDKKDWVRVENTHEPIVDRFYFEAVQTILERDTRMSGEKTYPLSGLIFCGDCGSPMFRKTNKGRKRFEEDIPKSYIYYLCRKSQNTKECTSHRMKEQELIETVFGELKFHINSVLDVKEALSNIEDAPSRQFEVMKFEKFISKKSEELHKAEKLKSGVYEDFKDDILDFEEYKKLKSEFDERILKAKEAIATYKKEIDDILNHNYNRYKWMEYFKEYRNLPELTRKVATLFIDRILVYEDNRIMIKYTFGDSFFEALEHLDTINKQKEVV